MRYKLLAALVFISCGLQAQQVNPVPDYVFQNRMSVGRTTVTDTLAYFSMGPRYGAIRGFMPPMVVDTALVTGGTKRNGLTIFSIQKNKYVYWDSVGSKWAEMAGTGGSAITGTGAAGYMPEFTTSTNLDSTTLYHSAGRFAIGSTTVSNGRFSVFGGQAYFDTSLKVGSQTFLADEGKNEVYVNTTTDAGAYSFQVSGNIIQTGDAVLGVNGRLGVNRTPTYNLDVKKEVTDNLETIIARLSGDNNVDGVSISFASRTSSTANNQQGRILVGDNVAFRDLALRIDELLVGDTIDNGAYRLQVAGSIYNTTGAVIGANSGLLAVGTTNASGFATVRSLMKSSGAQDSYIQLENGGGGGLILGSNNGAGMQVYRYSGSAPSETSLTKTLEINSNSELLVNNITDAGAYALQVAGAIYNTTGAAFAVSSGNVGIGTTSPSAKFDVRGNVNLTLSSGTNFTLNGSSGDVNQAFDVDLGKGGGNYNYLKFRYNNYNVITWGRSLTDYANKLTINSPEGPDAIISLQTLNLDRMFVSNSGEIILNSSNTDAGDYKLQVTGAIYNTTTLTTGAPTSGTAKPWRLGEAATVSPTSPNRTIRVEIDGTVYYIHAKTTND